MKYGKFVFKCNCGSETEFEPVREVLDHYQASNLNYNALEAGLDKAGIGWEHDTGCNEYMCAKCISAVDNTIDQADNVKSRAVESVLANRAKPVKECE